jgi:hypothetical protein
VFTMKDVVRFFAVKRKYMRSKTSMDSCCQEPLGRGNVSSQKMVEGRRELEEPLPLTHTWTHGQGATARLVGGAGLAQKCAVRGLLARDIEKNGTSLNIHGSTARPLGKHALTSAMSKLIVKGK